MLITFQFLIVSFLVGFNFSLKPQEASWRKHVKENDCNEMLVANCVTAAAFLAYCGPASIDVRYTAKLSQTL